MTYVHYYECDYCKRRLEDHWGSELKEGQLSGDGNGGHICDDCRLKQFSEAIAAVGASVRKGDANDTFTCNR